MSRKKPEGFQLFRCARVLLMIYLFEIRLLPRYLVSSLIILLRY